MVRNWEESSAMSEMRQVARGMQKDVRQRQGRQNRDQSHDRNADHERGVVPVPHVMSPPPQNTCSEAFGQPESRELSVPWWLNPPRLRNPEATAVQASSLQELWVRG